MVLQSEDGSVYSIDLVEVLLGTKKQAKINEVMGFKCSRDIGEVVCGWLRNRKRGSGLELD